MHSNGSNVIAALCTALLVVMLSLPAITPAQADVAPPPPPFGANPAGDNPDTRVQMVSETVIFDVDPASPIKDGSARVTASFQMRNQAETGEEQMQVRFPLAFVSDGECYGSAAPPISDLAARVNGSPVVTTPSFQSVPVFGGDSPKDETIPCWANFPVRFPAGKDVDIQVTYTALGYGPPKAKQQYPDESWGLAGEIPSATVSYWYVLGTGAGWYGPIGSADIIFRFPYPVNPQNVEFSGLDSNWKASGKELVWRQVNFEPQDLIRVYLTNPKVWQNILTETQATQTHPNDGEAWGQLGKAYKEAIWERRGFRNDPGGSAMFRLSDQAYQNATRLLPKDADWHYGYAELLCWGADWGDPTDPTGTAKLDYTPCIQQLKQALDLRPGDKKTLTTLGEISRFTAGKVVDLSGAQPDYLVLTPQPPTATLEVSPSLTPAPIQPSAAITVPIPTVARLNGAVSPTHTAALIQPTPPGSPARPASFSWPGAFGLFLLAALGFVVWKKRHSVTQ
jgi:hypothetical protein